MLSSLGDMKHETERHKTFKYGKKIPLQNINGVTERSQKVHKLKIYKADTETYSTVAEKYLMSEEVES
jgi:hypothetical protein